jgi:hypothetical protein
MEDLLRADIARLQPGAADAGWDTQTRYREMRPSDVIVPAVAVPDVIAEDESGTPKAL